MSVSESGSGDAGGRDGRFQYEDAYLAERRGANFLIVWDRGGIPRWEVEYRWTKGRGSVHEVWGQDFLQTSRKPNKRKSLFDQYEIM